MERATVRSYMTPHARTIEASAELAAVQKYLDAYEISSLVVVNHAGGLLGVISRTDLLRAREADDGSRVRDYMNQGLITIAEEAPLSEAAALLIEHRIHRLYVLRAGKLAGVISTKDLLRAIVDLRITTSIAAFMSQPVFSIEVTDPLSLATEMLIKGRVHGLVVVENEWPVGLFTQVEALKAQSLSLDVSVEQVMSYAMVCLPVETQLFRAAACCNEMNVRRLLAVEKRQVQGILSEFDFARALML